MYLDTERKHRIIGATDIKEKSVFKNYSQESEADLDRVRDMLNTVVEGDGWSKDIRAKGWQ